MRAFPKWPPPHTAQTYVGRFCDDALHACLGPDYEVLSVFVHTGDDLTRLHPAALASRLRERGPDSIRVRSSLQWGPNQPRASSPPPFHPTSRLPHPTSQFPHPTSHIPHLTSRTPHPAPHIPHPTSRILHAAPHNTGGRHRCALYFLWPTRFADGTPHQQMGMIPASPFFRCHCHIRHRD